MKNKQVDKNAIIKLFEDIKKCYPHLEMKIDVNHPHVDLMMDIPKQGGLSFGVNLNLQNVDELHLSAGHFWLEWFPCTKPEIVAEFKEAAHGVLSGKMRILESYRGQRAVKAELQEPSNGSWKTIGTWSTFSIPFPWQITKKELQNKSA